MKTSSIGTKLLLLAITLGVLGYFGVQGLQYIKDPLTTTIAYAYQVEDGMDLSGYVVREEHVLPDETIERVKGVDVMVLNCLRERQHPTHLSLERALGYLDQIAPKRAYLVHMCHDLTHKDWLARLAGTNVEPAYDGLKLNIGDKQ